jgi:hypothetical protein
MKSQMQVLHAPRWTDGHPCAIGSHLVRTVYNATDRPMQWRSLEGLVVPEIAEAARYAEERGWILVRDGHSVSLTEAGRRLMDQ